MTDGQNREVAAPLPILNKNPCNYVPGQPTLDKYAISVQPLAGGGEEDMMTKWLNPYLAVS
jgi:hypothetical protein